MMFKVGDLIKLKEDYFGDMSINETYKITSFRETSDDCLLYVENIRTGSVHRGIFDWRFYRAKNSNKNAY